jgi:hypothetical protein
MTCFSCELKGVRILARESFRSLLFSTILMVFSHGQIEIPGARGKPLIMVEKDDGADKVQLLSVPDSSVD